VWHNHVPLHNVLQIVKSVAQPCTSTQCIANYETCGTTTYLYTMYCKLWNVWHNHVPLHNALQSMELGAEQYNPTSCIGKPFCTVKQIKSWN